MYNNNTRAQWNYYILSIMLILFLATSSIFGANSKFNFINDKTRTSFEFMTVDNLIVIQAEINGIPVNLV
ncbi:MAG: hypothetical protein R3345_03340, partial [Fulvivirga sp.]|nr:hypothetical protein [Fulvivirga sp.]